MGILLRSALILGTIVVVGILGTIVVVGTALFAGPRLGELMERLAGAGFADDPEEAARTVDPPRVTGPGVDTQRPTIGSVMSSTDVEARSAKLAPTHVENATSPPRVDGEIADSPTASSDSAAGGLDGREEFEPSLVPSPSGLPAAVVRPVASWDIAYAQGQPGQLPADAGAAGGGGAVVADHAAGEAGQDRRPDRAPRSLRRAPASGGGGTAHLVRRDSASDRAPAAKAPAPGMRIESDEQRQPDR
jgi:hypothetical protein